MKVGSKGRYAVIAVTDVARHSSSGAVPLADVAARQKISLSYLEQLFAMLRRAGIVVSARGPGGGYRLAASPSQTTIRAIFEAVDETSLPNGEDDGPGDAEIAGAASELWADLDSHIRSFLDSVTIQDVLKGRKPVHADGAGLSRGAELS
jgi:Rrf2 family iron-sulfur cluster assembly transcriptional regulator